ncbi:hypothetical protein BDQ17DRAFT_1049825 [Cyathus striatus]|nr:hypothetical protein BDQ17DRAFT_1049825 [Cyathus striatus]
MLKGRSRENWLRQWVHSIVFPLLIQATYFRYYSLVHFYLYHSQYPAQGFIIHSSLAIFSPNGLSFAVTHSLPPFRCCATKQPGHLLLPWEGVVLVSSQYRVLGFVK